MAEETHRWHLTVDGRDHRVEVEGTWSRTIRWYVDDEVVATKKSSEDKVTLEPETENGLAVGLRFSSLGRARRVTLFEGDDNVPAKAKAVIGTGGLDLDPEAGSPAALREQRIREHPWRHATVATLGGVAKVVVPILLGLLVVRFAVNLPWPSWNIPFPDIDLPRIPWPEIPWPQIPWPDIDLPDWEVPAWVRWVADKAKYVWPVVLAFVLARAEVNRRRKQDELKAQRSAPPDPAVDRRPTEGDGETSG
jgi:hypothetical protein